MRTNWVALGVVWLGLLIGRSYAGELPTLPPYLPPAEAGHGTESQPHAPALSGEEAPATYHGLLAPYCEHGWLSSCCQQGGHCWDHVCAWFTYCPCRVTNCCHKHVPYNPQPPLYAYFFYPPVVDGPGHVYPCCNKHHVASIPDEHAGVEH